MTQSNGVGFRSIVNGENSLGYPERTFAMEVLPVHAGGNEQQGYPNALHRASEAIKLGHLVAFPTETVYGLGANALDQQAVRKIFAAKNRPADNPLIVHISDMAMLDRLVPSTYTFSDAYKALAQSFWPGPLTMLVPADVRRVPSVVRCGLSTLGVRIPGNDIARALIATANQPIAAPSANVSGRPSPTTAEHVAHDMITGREDGVVQGRIPYILDGGVCEVGLESTVIDGVTDAGELRILRPGGVSVERIEQALEAEGLLSPTSGKAGTVRVTVSGRDVQADIKAPPTTPGMKYRHYSPNARVVVLITDRESDGVRVGQSSHVEESKSLMQAISDELRAAEGTQPPFQVGLMSTDDSPLRDGLQALRQRGSQMDNSNPSFSVRTFSLGSSRRPEQAAQRLFDGLRTLDQDAVDDVAGPCTVIFVEATKTDSGVSLAIMNRLSKAASGRVFIRADG